MINNLLHLIIIKITEMISMMINTVHCSDSDDQDNDELVIHLIESFDVRHLIIMIKITKMIKMLVVLNPVYFKNVI